MLGQGLSRNAILFLLATALAVLIAGYALVGRNSLTGPIFDSRLMFPELADQLDDVTRIAVETSEGEFDVMREASGNWVIPNRGNYPASLAIVRATLRGVSTIELIEEKTARPDRHEALGLVAPSVGGDGVVLSLLGNADDVLARLVFGTIQSGGTGNAISLFYVRRADEDQTWLARSRLDVKDEITSWIVKNIIGIQRSDIRAAEITSKEGSSYKLARADADESNFTIADIPAGRIPESEFTVNSPAFALAALSITDVRAEEQVDFSAASQATYETFDNIAVDVNLAVAEDGHWISVQARFIEPEGAEGADETADAAAHNARDRVAEINDQTQGWVYSIPEFKYDQFTKPLEELLKPFDASSDENER